MSQSLRKDGVLATKAAAWVEHRPKLKQKAVALIAAGQTSWMWGKRLLYAVLVFVIFLAVIGDVLIYVAPSYPYGYAWKYNVAESKVVVEKRPHDCEWQSAPLGDKHCHYDAAVGSVRTGISKDGITPLVSFDGGKSWEINTNHLEPSVYVSWNKVDE